MKSISTWGVASFAAIACGAFASAATVTYENVVLDGSGYLNQIPFYTDGVTHSNTFTDWGGGFSSWDGFAISNHIDVKTPGYGNQYSAYPGSGAGGSTQFAVGYVGDPTTTRLTFSSLTNLAGCGASFANTTYTALVILNGDPGFGIEAFSPGDWFKLTITGYANNTSTGAVEFFLADYVTSPALVTDWQDVDFTPLGTVDEIRFNLSSTDNGPFGMNTPAYFAMDNLVVPEPDAALLLLGSGLGLFVRRRR